MLMKQGSNGHLKMLCMETKCCRSLLRVGIKNIWHLSINPVQTCICLCKICITKICSLICCPKQRWWWCLFLTPTGNYVIIGPSCQATMHFRGILKHKHLRRVYKVPDRKFLHFFETDVLCHNQSANVIIFWVLGLGVGCTNAFPVFAQLYETFHCNKS